MEKKPLSLHLIVVVVPTDEEIVIARDTKELIKK